MLSSTMSSLLFYWSLACLVLGSLSASSYLKLSNSDTLNICNDHE